MMTTLPSQDAAERFVRGEQGSALGVAMTTALRASLIAGGLYAVGQRKGVMRSALAGATAIEVFVLVWALAHKDPP